jgi:small subunit ribosomal protein S15
MLSREEKQKTIETFKKSATDTGSSVVQVALLTERIKQLTVHCDKYKKDFSTRRGLLNMVSRRRRYLNYIAKKSDAQQYEQLIQQLGLRK